MTNPLHYPSIALCKKLTEKGFPETEKVFLKQWEVSWISENENVVWTGTDKYVCPSIPEMLDVIKWKEKKILLYLEHNKEAIASQDHRYLIKVEWTTPNMLAEMCLWLVENGYISFNK